MRYLLTAKEMKYYDQTTSEKIGIPALVLMERAALSVFQTMQSKDLLQEEILIVAGMGNNGADGLALARMLLEAGAKVDVICAGNEEKSTEQWKVQRHILLSYNVPILRHIPDKPYAVIVDALFGVGLARDLEGDFFRLIEQMNQMAGYKVALDIPSGVHADTGSVMGIAFRADTTVTFGYEKLGLYLYPGVNYAGNIIRADIGISRHLLRENEPLHFCLDEMPKELLPSRKKDGNKGSFGKVLLIAGSQNMAGAAILAGKAAYRTGSGMVKVISPEENRLIIQETLPDALYDTPSGHLQDSIKWADVIGIGPGLSTSEVAYNLVKIVLSDSDKPLVLDADALNVISMHADLRNLLRESSHRERQCIITPHVGEMVRLLQAINISSDIRAVKKDIESYAGKLAEGYGCVVVAKDARTYVCGENTKICVNIRGNSGMAVAGSGDVLCGMILSLMGQGMKAYEAASAGVYFHALAGEKAVWKNGEYGCMASDIVEAIKDLYLDKKQA